MILKLPSTKKVLISILIAAAILRLVRLDFPNKFIFDEVYHAYTAKEYLKGNKDAWSPWGKSEPGVAFEWLHPPISKEVMTVSMFVLKTTDAWAWRLPGAIVGILSIFLVYKLGMLLFKNNLAAILSAFIFSIDGLVFVQSRIGMNDVYLVAFILASAIFFVKEKYFWASLFMGLACATKWPGIYLALIFIPILLYKRQFKNLIYFVLIPPTVYLLSYSPYFLIGYTWGDFIELHRQIWSYQTNLKATHSYSSPWWSWPLNLYPVWYFVDYGKNTIGNIFASGNPPVFWIGTLSLLLTAWQAFKKRSYNLMVIVLGFLVFWVPWAFSPRIMFLYHFSPSVPFLSLSLGYQLSQMLKNSQTKKVAIVLLIMMLLGFIFIYPFLVALPLPKDVVNIFFQTNLSKNPF